MNTTPPAHTQPPELTPEMQAVLERYLQIQEEERALREEKATLQDSLKDVMAQAPGRFWFPEIGQAKLKISYTERTEIVYDEALLRQRLGERYRLILRPDPRKLAESLADVEALLEPAIEAIGSPDRAKVKAAIENGTVAASEFAGAFTKSVVRRVAVSRQREQP